LLKIDAFVKSPKTLFSVIPVPVLRSSHATEGGKTGIQENQDVLDSRRSLSRTTCGAGVTTRVTFYEALKID
ncbi:MAG: hypothetical protein ABIG67_04045, partial [Pseudomonadota bacterium]